MAIQIKLVDVIDDNRNFINSAKLECGGNGTQTWTSGLKRINIGNGILYGPGSPNGTAPLPGAGDIKIDGTLTCGGIRYNLNETLYPTSLPSNSDPVY